MNDRSERSTMRIKLANERRERLVRAIREFAQSEFDKEMSVFRAEQLVDFFVRELGPPVYNQAIQDARAFIQEKLDDLEGEVYEPDEAH